MKRAILRTLAVSCCALTLIAAVAGTTSGASHTSSDAAEPAFAAGLYDELVLNGTSSPAFQRAKDAGATYIRIYVDLSNVAPHGSVAPTNFDWANPDDPHYTWGLTDAAVTEAVAAGLQPILDLDNSPAWARNAVQPGRYLPSAQWFGRFAQAAAKRYSGNFDGLPRVTYWEAWNEPNIELYLSPARINGALVAPDWYRSMLNAFASGVKRIDPTNLVIAGSLAPYDQIGGPGIPPLTFMRAFLCLDGARIRPRPRCVGKPIFDIWSMHPYTWGGPTHHATTAGDLALGDMPAMDAVLQQAWQAGRIISTSEPKFWVTEFSWNTNPPNPGGVPMDLQARWTAQALYTMWQSGVSMVTWFQLRDATATAGSGPGNSGLYFNGGSLANDTAKPTLEAFRFPTVAFPDVGGIRVWARTPSSAAGVVQFQQDTGAGWQTLGTLVADGSGVVTGVFPGVAIGNVRAIFTPTGETSLSFGLADVPDQAVNPFG
jgi:hypothetical protein